MERYYNLKLAQPDVQGIVLEVRPDADLEKRVCNFSDNASINIVLCDDQGNSKAENPALYEIVVPNLIYPRGIGRNILGGQIGIPVPVENGCPTKICVGLSADGDMLAIKATKGKVVVPVYLSEISAKNAAEYRESEQCWNMQRAWVYD